MSTQTVLPSSPLPIQSLVVCAVASLLLGVGLYVMPIKAVLDGVLHALLFSPDLLNCMALACIVFCLCALSKVDSRVYPKVARRLSGGLISAVGVLCISLTLSLIFSRAPDLDVYRTLMAEGRLSETPTDDVIERIWTGSRMPSVFKRTDCQALVRATPQDSMGHMTVNDRPVRAGASDTYLCGYGANVIRW